MIITSWNVRRLNGPPTQNKVVNVCRQHNISIFGVLKAKLKLDRVHSFIHRKFRNWDWCSNFEQINGGRILVVWNPSLVECTSLEITPQVIHCNILDKVTSKKFVCSFVYGANTVAARRELWISLFIMGQNMNDPWIVLGDFNSILSLRDRNDGILPYNSDMDDFLTRNTLLGLEDAPSVGSHFT